MSSSAGAAAAAPSSSSSASASSSTAQSAPQPKVQMVESTPVVDNDDDDDDESDGAEEEESEDDQGEERKKQPLPSESKPSTVAGATPSAAPSSSSSAGADADDLSSAFQSVVGASFAKDAHPAVASYYRKWNLDATCRMFKVRYLEAVNFLDPTATHAFLVGLFNSRAFRREWRQYQTKERRMEASLAPVTGDAPIVTKVNYKPVKATAIDLHFFDRIWTPTSSDGDQEEGSKFVHGTLDQDVLPELRTTAEEQSDDRATIGAGGSGTGSGALKKCFETMVDDGSIPITDELRKMVLDRDSDEYDLYSKEERQELMFILFQHLLVGGGLNQYENHIHPYLGVLKLIYRDLLTVRTNRNTNRVEIANLVFRVDNLVVQQRQQSSASTAPLKEEPFSIFGRRERDRFHLCLLSVDPQRRHVTCYYFAHTDAW